MRSIRSACAFLVALYPFFIVSTIDAQHQANANAMYRQLRDLMPGGDVINVSNFEVHRDAATLTFRQGSFAFYGEVNGKTTGAVFEGKGHLHITPPTAYERHTLSVTMRGEGSMRTSTRSYYGSLMEPQKNCAKPQPARASPIPTSARRPRNCGVLPAPAISLE